MTPPRGSRRRLSRQSRRLLQVAARHPQSSPGRRSHLDAAIHRPGRLSRRASMQSSTTISRQLCARGAPKMHSSPPTSATCSEDDLAKAIRYRDRRQSAGHRADALPGARPFFQSPDASPRPGSRAAFGRYRQRPHAKLRSDHLSARNRARRAAQDRLKPRAPRGCFDTGAVGQKARAMLIIDDLTVRIAGRVLLKAPPRAFPRAHALDW